MSIKTKSRDLTIDVWEPARSNRSVEKLRKFLDRQGAPATYCDPRWVNAISGSLHQKPYVIEAMKGDEVVGVLPVISIKSPLFGRFLVSLPYINCAGVLATEPDVATALIDRATHLADELDVRFLEIRHQFECEHEKLTQKLTSKVQMRLKLSNSSDEIWKGLKSVVRTQVRKAKKKGLELERGGLNLLDEFYDVFSRNMRDLGTPTYPRALFQNILTDLPEQTELFVVRLNGRAIAGCLVAHGKGITEVPSASALREYRDTAANSLMYWHAIKSAIERGQSEFDFGRSTIDGPTFNFKKKWGAQPVPVVWQYYVRKGLTKDMRPDNPKFQVAIELWKKLPLSLTRLLGPMIVRGIP